MAGFITLDCKLFGRCVQLGSSSGSFARVKAGLLSSPAPVSCRHQVLCPDYTDADHWCIRLVAHVVGQSQFGVFELTLASLALEL